MCMPTSILCNKNVPLILVMKKDTMYSFLNTHCFQKMSHFYNISFFFENELLESQFLFNK